ncbi:MAG TPA: hypothetical protein PKI11_19940 [Candidatus Hydrogenedentes bacterium]|nr:hypothetical protein [Candidatus Hydrogenedentota bacterium]
MKHLVIYLLVLAALLCGAAARGAVLERGILSIHYHESDRATADRALRILEEALAEFGEELPHGDASIRVIIAHDIPTFAVYARSFGSVEVAGLARPEEGLIVVKSPRLRRARQDFRGTLRHELVHILLARNTHPDYLPRWLNEGICMSLANEYYWNSLFHVARMYVNNRIIDYEDLDLRFRAPGDEMAFGDAYAQALSMTRFMRDRFGDDVFWAIVRGTRTDVLGAPLRKYTGMTVLDFWNAYRASLWKIALIGMIGSGSVFGIPAILLIIAYFRKRYTNRKVLDRWAVEEGDEDLIISLDDLAEGPYDWEEDDEDRP